MHAELAGAFSLDGDAGQSIARAEPNRDPRTDPQPGDVLAVGDDVREVQDRVGDRVEYGFPRRAASRWLPLMRWQAWARNADAIGRRGTQSRTDEVKAELRDGRPLTHNT